ncbi:MAG: hypothetical protein GY791_08020 [Alphaproteobacteria bacterium]|nr:hypothetical protein [Alphaproteobacteria bacterium]
MLAPPRRTLEALSISALDLFASALGVFILMAILLFPYYLKQPSQDIEMEGAVAELSSAKAEMEDMRLYSDQSADAMAEARAAMQEAEHALELAQSGMSAAAQARDIALERARAEAQKVAPPQPRQGNFVIPDLDLVFVMDTTGSMGEELRDIQVNLFGIIRVLHKLAPSLNAGFVAFKDYGDEYFTQAFALTPMNGSNIRAIQGFVEKLGAGGGGDKPEPVTAAMKVGLGMNWRPKAEARLIVIGDAPSHRVDWQEAFELAADFSAQRSADGKSRSISTIYTGNRNAPGAAFFKRLAEAGRGDFVVHRGQMIESVLLSVLES